MQKKFWKGKTVFVTGANGFVGSWLVKTLVEFDTRVIVLIKDKISGSLLYDKTVFPRLYKVVKGSLTDYARLEKIFKQNKIDVCFHLAAQAIVGKANRSPVPTFRSNIMGTWNLLEAARIHNVPRAVVASSDKAYGEHAKLPYHENFSLQALHPYDASKACTDILARTYAHTYGLNVAVTRCANIYGPGDMNFSRIIPDTIQAVLKNENPIIRSDGTPVRDYIYIKDVVNAYLTLAEKVHKPAVSGQAFNFGTGGHISVLNLVNKILRLTQKSYLKPEILSKTKIKGEIDKQYLSICKAKRLLGWKPHYTLDAGLKETFEWYGNYFK